MELPIIKNIEELATDAFRRDALDILEAGYEAVLTENVIAENVLLEESKTKSVLRIKNKKYDLKNN